MVRRSDPFGFEYEVSPRPWSGPKKRGLEMLEKVGRRMNACEPHEFIGFLRSHYGPLFDHIEWIKFHHFIKEKRSIAPRAARFAVINTSPSYVLRHLIFEESEAITASTGWYPLVMGARSRGFSRRPAFITRSDNLPEQIYKMRLGGMSSIRALGGAENGCSLLLQFELGSILLDFGFSYGSDELVGTPEIGILSHSHQDHAGGLRQLAAGSFPVFMTASSYWQLSAMRLLPFPPPNWLNQVMPPTSIQLVDGTSIEFLPGAHNPGAMLVRITSNRNEQLVFTGDYCLSNSYWSLDPTHLVSLFSSNVSNKFLLLDGTFIGHDPKEDSEYNLESLAELLNILCAQSRNSLFVAESGDYLSAMYIWLFRQLHTGIKSGYERNIVVSQEVLRVIESTVDMNLLHQIDRYDPFFKAVIGRSNWNYFETVRLYPMARGELPHGLPMPVDVFCTGTDVAEVGKQLPDDTEVFVIGRQGQILKDWAARESARGRRVAILGGPDFAFHSSGADVVRAVRGAADAGVHTLLFHNFPGRTRKTLSRAGIPNSAYTCVYTDEVRLAQDIASGTA